MLVKKAVEVGEPGRALMLSQAWAVRIVYDIGEGFILLFRAVRKGMARKTQLCAVILMPTSHQLKTRVGGNDCDIGAANITLKYYTHRV